MIEVGKIEDVERMVELGEMMHAESGYRDIPYDRVKVAGMLTALMVSEGVVFVSRRNGEIVGGLAGGVTEHWFSREKVGYEHALFLQQGARHGLSAIRLIRAFTHWCKGQGAKSIRMGITTGVSVAGTSRLFESEGFSPAGVFFSKEV